MAEEVKVPITLDMPGMATMTLADGRKLILRVLSDAMLPPPMPNMYRSAIGPNCAWVIDEERPKQNA